MVITLNIRRCLITMKRIFALLLVLCCLLTIMSCNENEDDESAAASTTEATEAVTEPLSEEQQIKQKAIKLLSKMKNLEDPTNLFDYFDGDFEMKGIKQEGGTISSRIYTIKKKGDFTYVSTDAQQLLGAQISDYYMYAKFQDNMNVSNAISLEVADSTKSTIFTSFGVDTSMLYGSESEDIPDPEFTSSTLTVSANKKLCYFSKEYMDELATSMICDTLGFTESQKATFLRKYQGNGTYSVDENKITFDISLRDVTLGTITCKQSFAIDDQDRVDCYSLMEYCNPRAGLEFPISVEITFNNVVYEGKKPVSATIQMKSSEEERGYDDPDMTITQVITYNFTLNCKDEDNLKAKASRKHENIKKYETATHTAVKETIIVIDQTKSESQFTLTTKRNGVENLFISADEIRFETPSTFPSVPNGLREYMENWLEFLP